MFVKSEANRPRAFCRSEVQKLDKAETAISRAESRNS